jgi:DNA-binding CsgD family transcriptional regulator
MGTAKPSHETSSGTFPVAKDDKLVAFTNEVVRDWQTRYRLTGAETNAFRQSLSGTSRDKLAAALGVTESTAKNEVHRLLKKTRDVSLDAAVIRGLREVLTKSSGIDPGAHARR